MLGLQFYLKMVAIIMATYNGAEYVASQIESIIGQTYKDWDLYIRDDGSCDETAKILLSYVKKYHNIHFIDDVYEKKGAKWNFMHLLEMVDEEYYMFCDQDDVWLPDKIEKSLNRLKEIEHKGCPALVCCDLKVVDQSLNVIFDSYWDYMKLRPSLLVNKKYAISCNLFTGCTMLFNKEAKNVSFPVSELMILHDYWVGLNVIAHKGNVSSINETLILYRQHSTNVCGAIPIGKNLSYYWGKIIGIKDVINDYNAKFRMANAVFNGRIGVLYFILNKIIYLIKR